MECLLCSSKNIFIKETHPMKDLISLWHFIDVKDILKTDKLILYQCNDCRLAFFDPQLAGGDSFYSELGKQDWYYSHPGKTEYDYVQKYIHSGDNILDIGAGIGVLFTKIKIQVTYTGLELSSQAVESAQKLNRNVKQEDLILHAQNNKSHYDIVCLFQVLEHLPVLDAFLKSIYIVLKDGGHFVISTPNNNGFISQTPNYTFNLPPHHIILWTESSLRYLAQKYKFDIVDIQVELLQDVHREYAYHSYCVYVIKKMLFLPNLLIDTSIGHRAISRGISIIFNIKFLKKIITSFVKRKQKYGQSIIITLKKQSLNK